MPAAAAAESTASRRSGWRRGTSRDYSWGRGRPDGSSPEYPQPRHERKHDRPVEEPSLDREQRRQTRERDRRGGVVDEHRDREPGEERDRHRRLAPRPRRADDGDSDRERDRRREDEVPLLEHPRVRERDAVLRHVREAAQAAVERAAEMIGGRRGGVGAEQRDDCGHAECERRHDHAPARAADRHGEHGERGRDDDRAAAVVAEPVLRDRRQRQQPDGAEREPTEPLAEQLRAEQRRHQQQRLQQVRDAVEAARQLRSERRERERPRMHGHHHRVGGEDADEREAERGARPEEPRAEDPAGDGAESEEDDARRGRAARRPAEREVGRERGAERGRRSRREEQRERDEQPQHDQRRNQCRAAGHFDPRLEPEHRRGRVAARLRVQRMRRLQRRARDVRHRDESRNAGEARRQRPVPAGAEDGDRIARAVLRRPLRRQPDDDQRPVRAESCSPWSRGSAPGRAAAAAARCTARRAPSRRTRRPRSCAAPRSARAGRPPHPARAPGGRRATAP